MDFLLCANALRSKWQCLAILQVDFSLSSESSKWQGCAVIVLQNAFYPSLRASHKASVAIHKFKHKFIFGLPRIYTLTLCKFSQWQIPCHTERSEVSINLKCEFAYLKRRFFALNLKYVLNLWIFRSFHSLKMTRVYLSYWARQSIHFYIVILNFA